MTKNTEEGRKCLLNRALNTFYLWMVIWHQTLARIIAQRVFKQLFEIYYMVKDCSDNKGKPGYLWPIPSD